MALDNSGQYVLLAGYGTCFSNFLSHYLLLWFCSQLSEKLYFAGHDVFVEGGV